MSNVGKGNYYKRKTKQYFTDRGYTCEYLEKAQHIFDKKTKRIFFVKRDMFASDLIAFNNEELLFVNSKFNRKNIASGLKEFAKYNFPLCRQIKCILAVWEKGAREPEIIEYEPEQEIIDLGE